MKPDFSHSEPRFDPGQLPRLVEEIDDRTALEWSVLLELFVFEAWPVASGSRQ